MCVDVLVGVNVSVIMCILVWIRVHVCVALWVCGRWQGHYGGFLRSIIVRACMCNVQLNPATSCIKLFTKS